MPAICSLPKSFGGANGSRFTQLRQSHTFTQTRSPKSFDWITSLQRAQCSPLWRWLPTCTIFLAFRTAAIISLPSSTLWVSGFSQYACLSASIAARRTSLWWWSGVAMMTASSPLCSSSFR